MTLTNRDLQSPVKKESAGFPCRALPCLAKVQRDCVTPYGK
jgi:hypothetical protein